MKIIILFIVFSTLTLITYSQISVGEKYNGNSKHFFYIRNTSFRKVTDTIRIAGIKADIVFIRTDKHNKVKQVEYYFKDDSYIHILEKYLNKKYRNREWSNDIMKATLKRTNMLSYELVLTETLLE